MDHVLGACRLPGKAFLDKSSPHLMHKRKHVCARARACVRACVRACACGRVRVSRKHEARVSRSLYAPLHEAIKLYDL